MTELTAGILLISNPFLKDPNFIRSVIFICDHQQNGAIGFVNSLVQNSNSLLEDLRRLNQLKDIQSQSDISSKKEDKPNNITAQPLKKVVKLKGQR